jgi:hypothetical protein
MVSKSSGWFCDDEKVNRLLVNLADDKPLSGFFLRPSALAPILMKYSQGDSLSNNEVSSLIDHCPIFLDLIETAKGQLQTALRKLAEVIAHRIEIVREGTYIVFFFSSQLCVSY